MATVQGLDRLKAKLAAMPQAAKQGIMPALNKKADELVAMQKRIVPVDDGDLRDSIEKTEGRHELAITVWAGGPTAIHARWVEFGASKTTAKPFFYPSYRALRKRIRSSISYASKKAAQKVAAGGN
jgi:HK97 gp10 family phage protein